MGISAGQFLREVVAWHWFAHAAFAGYCYLVYDVVLWFRGLPEPSTAQTFLVTTVVGIAPLMLNFYGGVMQRTPGAAP